MIIKDKLENGIRIVGQQMNSFRSVSLGVWVGAGSVYENEKEAGISHFIEHMAFKGTNRRSASDIAAEMDAVGGSINAYTAKEHTCFYTKVLGENLDLAADMLSDIVCSPKLDAGDIEKEKGVVCEEILMLQDDPEDLAHEILCETIYGSTPLASSILGSEETVRSFSAADIIDYMAKRYTTQNMVISCAGNFDMDRLKAALEGRFNRPQGEKGLLPNSSIIENRCFRAMEKDIEQVHICLGFPGFAADTKGQFALYVLNNALGGSMSSRLFQKIREENGLAYSVYSYSTSYSDTGYFTLYAGTGEKQAAKVSELILKELDQIKKQGITKAEFDRSKQQLKGNYLLGLESTSSRSSALGKGELMYNRVDSEEELIRRIESVSMDDVMEIIPQVLNYDRMAGAFVGRIGKRESEVKRIFDEA